MIKLELTNYSSADVDEIWNWNPSDSSDVCFQFQFEIGEVGKSGGTYFQALVATPEGLRKALDVGNVTIPDRNILIFDIYELLSTLVF